MAGLAAALAGGILVWRSRVKAAWDEEAGTLARDTQAIVATRLPPVLTGVTTRQRSMSWPPLRTDLMTLLRRWQQLAERATGDGRKSWSAEVGGLVRELVAAVDAENAALADGRDWRLLRPRLNDLERALLFALAERWGTGASAVSEPGLPPYSA